MKRIRPFVFIPVLSLFVASVVQASVVDQLLSEYQRQGATAFDASRGASMWTQEHPDAKSGKQRSCASCHTKDLSAAGKHAKTGKKIEPLAPSVNRERLTDSKEIRKWLKRNCKWTLGRECSAQEKGDFLTYIRGL